MATQPDTNLWHVDLDGMQVHEPGQPSSLIVDSTMPFEISVRVDGKGGTFKSIEALSASLATPLTFTVNYYAERFGGQPGEKDLGSVKVDWVGGPYDNPDTALTVPAGMQPGVYRIMCLAKFLAGHSAFPEEELLIEVY